MNLGQGFLCIYVLLLLLLLPLLNTNAKYVQNMFHDGMIKNIRIILIHIFCSYSYFDILEFLKHSLQF